MKSYIIRRLLLFISLLLLLSIIQTAKITYTVYRVALPNYTVIFGTKGGYYCSGCPVGCTPYEEKAFTTTRQYFYNELIDWLKLHDKNVDVHDTIKEIAGHNYDRTWLRQRFTEYYSNLPKYGVLISFEEHASTTDISIYRFFSRVDHPDTRFPSAWARTEDPVKVNAGGVGDIVRNKPLTDLPALVVMYNCNTAGWIENGEPRLAYYRGTWLWAYKFDDPSTWVYYVSGIEHNRAFIGWLTKMNVNPYEVPEEIRAVTEALKYAIANMETVMYSIDHYFTMHSIWLNVYYDYKVGNSRYSETKTYNPRCYLLPGGCHWIAYVGGANPYINPNTTDHLIDYVLDYMESYYPQLYELIKSNNEVSVSIEKGLYDLILSNNTRIEYRIVEWRDRGNFTISSRVYMINNKFIFGGLAISFDELSDIKYEKLINNTFDDFRKDFDKSINELEKHGFNVEIRSEKMNSREYYIKIDKNVLVLLSSNEHLIYIPHASVEHRVPGLGVDAYTRYFTDYYLLEYLMKYYYKENNKVYKILDKEAIVSKVIDYLKQKGENINEKNYKTTILGNLTALYNYTYTPVYFVELTVNEKKFRFIVDGISGNILNHNPGYLVSLGSSNNEYINRDNRDMDNRLAEFILIATIPIILIAAITIYVVKHKIRK
ncbi:MAG: hypothetical protein B6U89_03755 [Desulfurococcales archaeon ex4484_58]|nr:MAG: hypothetical protein B6U89_03755 [Desulfurococcales archaeon ex4484_58]